MKRVIYGILELVIVSVKSHVKLMNIQILKPVHAKNGQAKNRM